MNTYRVTITAEALNLAETIIVNADNEAQARGEAMIQRRKSGGRRLGGAHVTYSVEKVA